MHFNLSENDAFNLSENIECKLKALRAGKGQKVFIEIALFRLC